MIPPLLDEGADALVILDWSGWTHAAWHRVGPEGLIRSVAGDLLALLADPAPPRLVRAVDSGLPTHRHEMTAHFDAPKRYKAHRGAKPRDFFEIVERLDALVDELKIPTLWPADFEPQTWEADDAAATACARARAEGLPVVLLSRDKDWRQLVTDEAPRVVWWDGHEKALDRAGVIGEHGVPPELLGDWLALVGDTSDNIPGAAGIGEDSATALLRAWRDLDSILARGPLGPEQIAEMKRELEAVRRKRDAVKKKFGDATALIEDAAKRATDLDLWKLHAVVHAQRDAVELSRRLVELRDVPIELDLDEAIVGGWTADRVRRVLRDLGVGHLGGDLTSCRKRQRARRDGGPAAVVEREPTDLASAESVSSGDRREGAALRRDGGAVERQAEAGGVDGAPATGAEPAAPAPPTPTAARPGPSSERRPATGEGPAEGTDLLGPWVREVLAAIAADARPPNPPPPFDGEPYAQRIAIVDTALAVGELDRNQTMLGRAYAVEDLEDKRRFKRCDPAVRAAVIAELRRRGVADLGRRGAA